MSTYLTSLLQRAAAQAPAAAPQQQPATSGQPATAFAPSLSADVLNQLKTTPDSHWTDPATGISYYGQWTPAYTDEMGVLSAPTFQRILGEQNMGDTSRPFGSKVPLASYDASGNFTGVGYGYAGGVPDDLADKLGMALFTGIAGAGLAAAAGGLGGMGAEGFGAEGVGADFVQANSINALDSATGVGYGSEGSLLTGGAEPSSLLTGGANTTQLGSMEGNAAQGLSPGAGSGTGLTMPTAPNLEVTGGAQGLTTTGAQSLGDPASFINDPSWQFAGAGSQTVSAAGTFNPYVPSLGDPASFINGGAQAAGSSLSLAPGDVLKGIQLGGQLAGLLGGSGSLGGGGGQASYAGGGVGGTADSSNAGLAPSLGAQGGAAGSIEGVANTLLTAKDTFGYGKTMLV